MATVLTNLGSIFRSHRKNSDSKDLYEQTLAIQEEILEASHPSVRKLNSEMFLHLLYFCLVCLFMSSVSLIFLIFFSR